MSETVTPTLSRQPDVEREPSAEQLVCRNLGFLAIGKVLTNVCAFVFFAMLSRAFGQEGVGQYAFATACAGFFAVAADFGLYELTLREISRHSATAGPYFREIFYIRLLLYVAFFGLFFALVPFVPLLWEMRWVAGILMLQQMTFTLVDSLLGVFIARNDAHLASGCVVAFRLASAIAGALAIAAGGSFLVVLSTQPVITFAQLATVTWLAGKRYGSVWPTMPAWGVLRQTLHTAMPFAFSGVLLQISSRIDVIVLTILLGSVATGVYSAAYRVVFMLLFVPPLIALSVFPLAAKLSMTTPTALPGLYNKVHNEVLLFGLPICAGVWLTAPHLIPLLFGPDFSDSVLLLRILAWVFLATCYRSVLETFLLSCDLQHTRAKVQWRAACFGTVVTVLLIQGVGVAGAAIATLVAEGVVVVLYVYHLKGRLGWPIFDARVAISLLATSAFVVPLSLYALDSLAVIIGLAVAIYAGTLLLFKEIRRNEGLLALDMLKRLGGRLWVRNQAMSET